MNVEKQFSVFMVNKPGILSQMLSSLAKAKVNIVALTVVDSVEHGVMRIVSDDSEKLRDVLKRDNVQFNETDVLCVTIPNRSGAFAAITERLASTHINVSYAYCTAGAKGGKTTAVLKVADVKKAIKVLTNIAGKTVRPTKPTTRRSPAKKALGR